jgi:hypothetical protein
VAITSIVRRRLGHRRWRLVHWSAYGCWPLALVHGLGTGTDTQLPSMLAVSVACVLAVLVAVSWRIGATPPGHPGRRLAASLLAIGPAALIFWLAAGPLAGNWAERAGTPAGLLASVRSTRELTSTASTLRAPFTADLAGSVRQGAASESGLVTVSLPMAMSGGARGTLHVQMVGTPLGGGGLAMADSAVSLGPPGRPGLYAGHLVALDGTHMAAEVADGSGSSIRLEVDLSIDQATGRVSGSVHAAPPQVGEADE